MDIDALKKYYVEGREEGSVFANTGALPSVRLNIVDTPALQRGVRKMSVQFVSEGVDVLLFVHLMERALERVEGMERSGAT